MNNPQLTRILTETVNRLSEAESMNGLFCQHREGTPLPSAQALGEIVGLARAILFPGYYGRSSVDTKTIRYHIGVNTERLHRMLTEQILAGLCFADACGGHNTGSKDWQQITEAKHHAEDLSAAFIAQLPEIRRILGTDVAAAYDGDPAAESHGEVISCYPAIKALTCYRMAHVLQVLHVPLIPRMITEMAHSETGIDIHPAAQIGTHFTIDHGTGVVIGATCIIGNHVKLYQGVTLGAKSFPLDDQGNPIKGIDRHPILGDGVVIYANATVLGRITIGEGCVVGANEWVTEDMPPHTRKYKKD